MDLEKLLQKELSRPETAYNPSDTGPTGEGGQKAPKADAMTEGIMRRFIPKIQTTETPQPPALEEQQAKQVAALFGVGPAMQRFAMDGQILETPLLNEIRSALARFENAPGVQGRILSLLDYIRRRTGKIEEGAAPAAEQATPKPVAKINKPSPLTISESLMKGDPCWVLQDGWLKQCSFQSRDGKAVKLISENGPIVSLLMNVIPTGFCPLCETMGSPDETECAACGLDLPKFGAKALTALQEGKHAFRHGWFLRRKGFKPVIGATGPAVEFTHDKHGKIKVFHADGQWQHGDATGLDMDSLQKHLDKL
jgi:hypothetical protein